MVTAPEQEPATRAGRVEIGPPPPEGLLSFLRRWRRSLSRHRGLRYWLSVYGLVIFPSFVLLFVINGFVVGWKAAYNVGAQIDSPWDTSAPWLAVFLSLAGWLVIPALVGAVVGQVVVEMTDNRRGRSPGVAQREQPRGANYIPLLNRLLYSGRGFRVRRNFPEEFVRFHHGNWNIAQSHWEIMVGDYLTSLATDGRSRLTAKQTMIHAVNAAAALLPEPVTGCPFCPRPAKDSTEGGTVP
jgi:uncharacterized protein DUF6313